MSKHLIDLDENALSKARAELGTVKETVNESVRFVAGRRDPRVTEALDLLGDSELLERSEAWR